MFRKLLALEVAALMSNDESNSRSERRDENDTLGNIREAFMPRTGNYGSMWSKRSFG